MAGTARWVKLDVDYFRNPKARAAGRTGRALHLASIAYSGSQLTDGRISADTLAVILAEAGVPPRAVRLVVAAGLWVPDASGGFQVHDFTETNGTREETLARIAHENERKARWRASKASRNGDAT